MSACFRNSCGEFTAGFTQWWQLTLSTEEGEAWALLQAMNEAKDKGLEQVQFESGSQVLVEAIRTKRKSNSEFFQLLMILSLLCYLVQTLKLSLLWNKWIRLLILYLGWPILGLVSIYLRLFLHVLNLWYLMKCIKFVWVKKILFFFIKFFQIVNMCLNIYRLELCSSSPSYWITRYSTLIFTASKTWI
jgi:hypothetical protein